MGAFPDLVRMVVVSILRMFEINCIYNIGNNLKKFKE